MSFDDEQDYLILSRIHHINREDNFESRRYQEIFKNVFGNSWKLVYDRFQRQGLFNELTIGETQSRIYISYTSHMGREKFLNLKKKKKQNYIFKAVGWITLAASVVSAVFAVIGYPGCNPSNKIQEKKIELKQEQPSKVPPQTLKPDTTKVRDTVLKPFDSVGKKKNQQP